MHRIYICFIILTIIPQMAYPGAWSQKKGHLGIKLSYFSLVTDERFSTGGGLESRCLVDASPGCFLQALDGGVRVPVFSDIQGVAKSRALFITTEFGLLKRISISAQIGYFSSENDFDIPVPQSISTKSDGFSDLRVNLKYQYFSRGKFAAALSSGFKAPTGEFNRNAFGVSLGEGGWDYQISHDLGISLWPLPIYGNLNIGYRWRQKNQAEIDYGDEFLYNVEAGINLHKHVLFKIAYFGLNADSDRQFLGIGRSRTPGRKINFLAFSLFVTVAKVELELGAEHTLSGQNYISGTKFNAGISRTFKLF